MKTAHWFVCILWAAAAASAAQEPARDGAAPTPQQQQVKMMSLSLSDCYEMALRRNLDITIERIGPKLADAALLAEHAAFEPALSASANFLSSSSPLTARQQASSPAAVVTRSEQIQTSFSLGGRIPTGLQYRFSLENTGYASSLNSFNTEYSAFAGFSLTQPLLKNAWGDANLVGLRVAGKSKEIAREAVTAQVMSIIATVQKAYYDLVFVIRDLEVRRESLRVAETLLEENKTRLKAGVMSPLDVTEAEAAVATRREDVLVGERAVLDQENVLKRLISDDVASLRHTRFVPVDEPSVKEAEVNLDASIRTAFNKRPDLRQARKEVERRDLLWHFAGNQLWPQVDLLASYGLNGLRGDYFPAYRNALEGDNPQWLVGLTVTIPLGNQKAQANHQTAKLESERAQLNLKRVEQNAIVEVDTAVGQVQTNFKRIEAAAVARRLAEEKLAAEEKKLKAGTSTSFFVLQYQQDVARARANELRAILDYNKSLVNLFTAEGSLLERCKIEIKDE